MFTSKYISLLLSLLTLGALLAHSFTNIPVNPVLFYVWGIYTFLSTLTDYYMKNNLDNLRESLTKNLYVLRTDKNNEGDNDDAS